MLYVLLSGEMPFYMAGKDEDPRPKSLLPQQLSCFYASRGPKWAAISDNGACRSDAVTPGLLRVPCPRSLTD